MLTTSIRSATTGLFGLIGQGGVPLAAQTNLTATATAPTTVAPSWTGASGANGYWILRGVGALGGLERRFHRPGQQWR